MMARYLAVQRRKCIALSPKDSLSGEQAGIAAQRLNRYKAQNAFCGADHSAP